MFPVGGFILGIMAIEMEDRLQRLEANRQLRIHRQRLRDASNPFELAP